MCSRSSSVGEGAFSDPPPPPRPPSPLCSLQYPLSVFQLFNCDLTPGENVKNKTFFFFIYNLILAFRPGHVELHRGFLQL